MAEIEYVSADAMAEDSARPAPRTPHESLVGSFIDLSPTTTGSFQTLGIEATFDHAAAGIEGTLPIQAHPAGGLRERILRELGLHAYSCALPADLPERLRTPRWSTLVEWTENIDELPAASWRNVLALCQAMSLYETVATVARGLLDRHWRTEDPMDSDIGAWLLLRHNRARVVLAETEQAWRDYLDTLKRAVSARHLPLKLRLSTAMTLVVLHSKGRLKNLAAAIAWRQVAERLYSSFDETSDWTGLAQSSAYWRAISFVPFHQGDSASVVRELGLAEEYGRAVPADTFAQRIVGGQNLHPLLETRTKEALWLGDRPLALARTEELVRNDPFEPKVHLQLGDLHAESGDDQAAIACYRQACLLGAPYTALSRYKLGRALQRTGELDECLSWLGLALRAEPRARTCAEAALQIEEQKGDRAMQSWVRSLTYSLPAGGVKTR